MFAQTPWCWQLWTGLTAHLWTRDQDKCMFVLGELKRERLPAAQSKCSGRRALGGGAARRGLGNGAGFPRKTQQIHVLLLDDFYKMTLEGEETGGVTLFTLIYII